MKQQQDNKPIPPPYKKKAELLINWIGDSAQQLLPIITEFGDNLVIKSGDAIIFIKRDKSNDENTYHTGGQNER